MAPKYSPKQVARALDVSESSVKRWCDQGELRAEYTPGGHRKIALANLIEFVRGGEMRRLVRPEVVGLPAVTGLGAGVTGRAAQQLAVHLTGGDEEACRRLILNLYLGGKTVPDICDQVIAEAFREVGRRWECGEAEVYEERRACEICVRILHELRGSLPVPPMDAPFAMGGAPEQDNYSLPTTMVEITMRSLGWQAVSLGSNLPFETLGAAIVTHTPRLFWLSVSYLEEESRFIARFSALREEARSRTTLVLGGRALSTPLVGKLTPVTFCENLGGLVGVATDMVEKTG